MSNKDLLAQCEGTCETFSPIPMVGRNEEGKSWRMPRGTMVVNTMC